MNDLLRLRLFAQGEELDVDACVRQTALAISRTWRRGEISDAPLPATSGVEIVLDEGRDLSIFEQERIAVAYLRAEHEALSALARFPGVTSFILALQLPVDVDEGLTGFTTSLSFALMKECLELRIAPTVYVWPRIVHHDPAG